MTGAHDPVTLAVPALELAPAAFAPEGAGWVAGLTTRALDLRSGDRRANAAAIARALGLPEGAPLARGEQVHAAVVAPVDGTETAPAPGADAVSTSTPGVVLLALGADCPGIALAAEDVPAVAAAHSGWRGTVKDVGPAAAAALVARGARLSRLRAWVGPGIGPCCFEVGDEVVHAIEAAHGPLGLLVKPGPRGRPHVDLARAIARRLAATGLDPAKIQVDGRCTRCARDRFYSRRGEGPDCGHHAVAIALRPR